MGGGLRFPSKAAVTARALSLPEKKGGGKNRKKNGKPRRKKNKSLSGHAQRNDRGAERN